MSQENVDVMRRALEAFDAGDVEGLIAFTDPVIQSEPQLAELQGNYEGHAGIREFMADAFEYGDVRVVRIEQPDVRDLGDRVLAVGRFQIYWGARAAWTSRCPSRSWRQSEEG
jgi:ketosteroid isomerase-like protein